MTKDYYKILGISKDATTEDIKKAFRKLAMQYHPDRNPNKQEWANEKFKEINEAYATLGDPAKREQYDHFGTMGSASDIFSSPYTRVVFEELIKSFNSTGLGLDFLDIIFSGVFGGKPATSWVNFTDLNKVKFEPEISNDVCYEVAISKEEATSGVTKVLTRKGRKIEVKIPSGVKKGNIIRLANARQVTDGKPGDILIQIKVKND